MATCLAEKWGEILEQLPQNSNVAVLYLLGSLCPITLAHTQCFEVAREVLLGDTPEYRQYLPPDTEDFAEVLGAIALNADSYVGQKMRKAGCESLNFVHRRHLVELSIQDKPWMGIADKSDRFKPALCKRFPQLNFAFYCLNGADDVVKSRKWNDARAGRRFFTVGRPGSTSQIGTPPGGKSPFFIVGPELPDISSTEVRNLLQKGDADGLTGLLHPDVSEWCFQHGAFGATLRPSSSSAAVHSAAASSSQTTVSASQSSQADPEILQLSQAAPAPHPAQADAKDSASVRELVTSLPEEPSLPGQAQAGAGAGAGAQAATSKPSRWNRSSKTSAAASEA